MSFTTQEFVPGIDMSGQVLASGAELNQLVDAGFPATGRGIIIYSADVLGVPDVPNPADAARWVRYIWVRQLAASVIAYVWNTGAEIDAIYLKWQSITLSSLSDGVVTNAKIADNAVTDRTVNDVAFSKITGVPAWYNLTGGTGNVAGGALVGTYPNPTLAAGSVPAASIPDNSITNAKLVDATILTGKIALGTILATNLADNTGVTAAKLTQGAYFYLGVVGGSADGLTVTAASFTLASVGVRFVVKVLTANTTTTPTLTINPLAAVITLKNQYGGALWAGALQAGDILECIMDDATNARIVNLSHKIYAPAAVSITDANFPAATVKDWGVHGLNGIPRKIRGYLKCTSTDLGFAVGDMLPLEYTFDAGGSSQFSMPFADATNLYTVNVRTPIVGTGCAIRRRTGGTVGTYTTIASAKWDFYVEAEI